MLKCIKFINKVQIILLYKVHWFSIIQIHFEIRQIQIFFFLVKPRFPLEMLSSNNWNITLPANWQNGNIDKRWDLGRGFYQYSDAIEKNPLAEMKFYRLFYLFTIRWLCCDVENRKFNKESNCLCAVLYRNVLCAYTFEVVLPVHCYSIWSIIVFIYLAAAVDRKLSDPEWIKDGTWEWAKSMARNLKWLARILQFLAQWRSYMTIHQWKRDQPIRCPSLMILLRPGVPIFLSSYWAFFRMAIERSTAIN